MNTKLKGYQRVSDNEDCIHYTYSDLKSGEKVLDIVLSKNYIQIIPDKGDVVTYHLSKKSKYRITLRDIDVLISKIKVQYEDKTDA